MTDDHRYNGLTPPFGRLDNIVISTIIRQSKRSPDRRYYSSTTTINIPNTLIILAAAAAVSKARCEVDAEAAAQAASTLALEHDDGGDDPVITPFKEVYKLFKLAFIRR